MGTQALWFAQSSSSLYAVEQSGPSPVSCATASTCEVDFEVEYEGQVTPRKKVPVGAEFQAELPWLISRKRCLDSGTHEPDSLRWFGEHVWPKESEPIVTEKSVSSRASYGICSCASRDAVECVRLHIEEKRKALKNELGEAFYMWGFHEMGETVAEHWTGADELTFQQLVRQNPTSFWCDLFEAFPTRSTRELVSYYFNVFVLRKRAIQNRLDPGNVDSDDDEILLDSDDEEGSGCIFGSDKEVNGSQVDDAQSEGDEVDGFPSHCLDDSGDDLHDLSSHSGKESGDENADTFGCDKSSDMLKAVQDHVCVKASRAVSMQQQMMKPEKKQFLSPECNHESRNEGNNFEATRAWERLSEEDQSTGGQCSNRDDENPEMASLTCSRAERQTFVWDTPAPLSSPKDVDKLISTKGMIEEFFGSESLK